MWFLSKIISSSNATLNLTSQIFEAGIQLDEVRFRSNFWSDEVGTENCPHVYILDEKDEYFILPSGLLHHVNPDLLTPLYCVETFQVFISLFSTQQLHLI